MRIQSALLLAIVFLTSNLVRAQYQGRVSFVPAGTPVSVTMNQALSSEFTRVGETFSATLGSGLYAGSEVIAPPGSQVQGQVIAVEPAGRAGRPGSMDLRLTGIVTADGRRIPLSAAVNKSIFELRADSSRAGHFVKNTAVGAGAGALSGLVGAAISGGKKGKATAIGTGIGGGIGLLAGGVKKGDDLVIQSGTAIPFTLDQPVQAYNTAAPVQEFGFGQQQSFPNPYATPQGQAPYAAPNPYSAPTGQDPYSAPNPYLSPYLGN
jgi:hypothetical protein